MKKLLAAVVVVLAASAVAVGIASGSGGGGTVVAEGFACGLYDGNQNIFITTNSQEIKYANKVVLRCSGDGAPAASLTVFSGFLCSTVTAGLTTDTTDKVGRNGNSQLTCTVDTTAPASSSSGTAGVAG
jgi:hypothetical protein